MARPRKHPIETPEVEPLSKRRVIIPFRDGEPDVSQVPPEIAEKLRGAFAPASSGETAEKIPTDPRLVLMVVNALGTLEASILSAKTKLPLSELRELIGPREPIATMIAESGARVLDKYGALGRWGDEIALCSALLMWQGGIFTALSALKSEREKESESGAIA